MKASVSDVYDALSNVLPHVSTNRLLTNLCGVQLSWAAGVATMTATDRYTVARQMFPCTSDVDGSIIIPTGLAKDVIRLLKTATGDVSISHDSEEMVDFSVSSDSVSGSILGSNNYPPVGSLIDQAGSREPGSVECITLNPALLARFSKLWVDQKLTKTPIRLKFTGPTKPVLVTATDIAGFTALVMPLRAGGE